MKDYRTMLWILMGIGSILVIPFVAANIRYGGVFPDGYFAFPLTEAPAKPGFELWYFLIILALVLFTASLYLVPGWYGFRQSIPEPSEARRTRLPWWFWAGCSLAVPLMVLAWGKYSQPSWLIPYIYVPMFWAFALVLDGIVYRRANGHSFLSDCSSVFFAVAFCSAFNWAFFDYLNFFLGGNWYYPQADTIPLVAFVIYALAGSMTLAPMVFIVYRLMLTYPRLKARYARGPEIRLSMTAKYLLLIVFSAGMFAVPFYPDELYPLLWVCPTFIMAAVLGICGIWTPLSPIKHGDWSALALVALAGFVQGFLWEGMNYLSASHHPFATHIPGYWIYSIPYVSMGYIFEMPVLGFFGYMPYGLFCWIFWIAFASLLHIPAQISIDVMKK